MLDKGRLGGSVSWTTDSISAQVSTQGCEFKARAVTKDRQDPNTGNRSTVQGDRSPPTSGGRRAVFLGRDSTTPQSCSLQLSQSVLPWCVFPAGLPAQCVQSVGCARDTNVTLCVNYTLIKTRKIPAGFFVHFDIRILIFIWKSGRPKITKTTLKTEKTSLKD